MRFQKVTDYPSYKISDCGKLFSLKSNRFLNGDVDRYGYARYTLFNKNGRKVHTVHRLVAIHFVNGNTALQVNHKDGNKLNNHYTNLEWLTAGENTRYSFSHLGRDISGSKNPAAKITEETALSIISDLSLGVTQHTIAKKYQISRSTISMIAINKIWTKLNKNLNGKEKHSQVSDLQENI